MTLESDDILTPKDRADLIRKIAKISPYDESGDAYDLIVDILANLRHFADDEGLNYSECDRFAYNHYLAELNAARQAAERKEA